MSLTETGAPTLGIDLGTSGVKALLLTVTPVAGSGAGDPVAVNATGEPVSPVALAWAVCWPNALPSSWV